MAKKEIVLSLISGPKNVMGYPERDPGFSVKYNLDKRPSETIQPLDPQGKNKPRRSR